MAQTTVQNFVVLARLSDNVLKKIPIGEPEAEDLVKRDIEVVIVVAGRAKKVEPSLFCLCENVSFDFALLDICLE